MTRKHEVPDFLKRLREKNNQQPIAKNTRVARSADWLHQWPITRFCHAIGPFVLLLTISAFYVEYTARHLERRIADEERVHRLHDRKVSAWQLLTTKAPGNSGKIEALEYLNSISEPLNGIDLSVDQSQSGTWLVGINLEGATLENSNLSDSILTEANFQGVIFYYTNLRRANLYEADLNGADLSWADFTDAELSSADLSNTILNNTDLIGAELVRTDLRDSHIASANFTGANLSGQVSKGPRYIDGTEVGANLSNAMLHNAVFFEADLTNAILSDSVSDDANFTDANLSGSDLRRVDFTNVNFKGANLSAANLNSASLIAASFGGASLKGADFSNITAGDELHEIIASIANLRGRAKKSSLAKQDILMNGVYEKVIAFENFKREKNNDVDYYDRITWAFESGENYEIFKTLQAFRAFSHFRAFKAYEDIKEDEDIYDYFEITELKAFKEIIISQANLRGAKNLTCEQLQTSISWEEAYRDDELACGAPIPQEMHYWPIFE